MLEDSWTPAQKFTMVPTPSIKGFFADLTEAGSSADVTHTSADTEYVVLYAPANVISNKEEVTQTVHYQYADGMTAGRPTIPQDDVQTVAFHQTITINPWNGNEHKSDWDPQSNQFKIVTTPTIPGFYADQSQAGSDDAVTANDNDKYYVVNYAAPITTIGQQKTVHQYIKYVYADGITAGRPSLPANDTQELVFSKLEVRNPWTNDLISSSWTPAQQFTIMQTPDLPGFYPDYAEAGSDADVTQDSEDTTYVVKYAAPVTTTDQKVVRQTIHYEYADGVTAGRPSLPENNVQSLTFTHTIVRNPWTNDVLSDTWTPAQSFATVVSPSIHGFAPDYASIEGQSVDHNSQDLTYVVKYHQLDHEQPEQVPDGGEEQPTRPGHSDSPNSNSTVTMLSPNNTHSNHQTTRQLPQTGNDHASELTSLGLVSGMLGLAGLLGKRKRN